MEVQKFEDRGADVEAAFGMLVDIISSATEILMKFVLYIHTAEHSDILVNHNSYSSCKYMNTPTIFDNYT